jgi:uncharacterized protein YbjQ (UPF0145 family)
MSDSIDSEVAGPSASDPMCVSCRKPKAIFDCEICSESSCKKCGTIMAGDTFSFMAQIPDDLKHTYYCGHCFDTVVEPATGEYQETMERAKAAFVFFKTQRKEVPLIKKERTTQYVDNCVDRDETILRLAFYAAELGHNAVIDCEVESQKVRDGAYQTSRWKGEGVAATVDGVKIEAQDLRNRMYR